MYNYIIALIIPVVILIFIFLYFSFRKEVFQKINICICMSYTDNIKSYSSIAEKINEKYAKKNGYDFKVFSHKMNDRAPQWCKISVINELLSYNKYDYIFWIDSDAFFNKHDFKLENIINKNKNEEIIICDDIKNSGGRKNAINTGTIFVKCSEWSKKFFKLLWDYKGPYLYEPFHEQRKIEDFIEEKIMDSHLKIAIKPANLFNTEYYLLDNDKIKNNFIIHVMSKPENYRVEYMQKWVKNNNTI
jgi:hypothetical protein